MLLLYEFQYSCETENPAILLMKVITRLFMTLNLYMPIRSIVATDIDYVAVIRTTEVVVMSELMIRNKPNTEINVLGTFFLIDIYLIQSYMLYIYNMIKYIQVKVSIEYIKLSTKGIMFDKSVAVTWRMTDF